MAKRNHGPYARIPSRVYDDKRLNEFDKDLLGVLATHADPDGWCHPKLRTIAARFGYSKSTASRRVARLEKLGYILILKQTNPNTGASEVNRYRIIHDAELPEEFRRIKSTPLQEDTGDCNAPLQEHEGECNPPLQSSEEAWNALLQADQGSCNPPLQEHEGKCDIEQPNGTTQLNISPAGAGQVQNPKLAVEYGKQKILEACTGFDPDRKKGASHPRLAAEEEKVYWAAKMMSIILQEDIPADRIWKMPIDRAMIRECVWLAGDIVTNINKKTWTREDYERAFTHFREAGGEPYRTGKKAGRGMSVAQDVAMWLQRSRQEQEAISKPIGQVFW